MDAQHSDFEDASSTTGRVRVHEPHASLGPSRWNYACMRIRYVPISRLDSALGLLDTSK